MKVNIGIVTTCRADYGILENLINLLNKNKKIKLNLLISGAHYAKKYGNTFNEIKKNNVKFSKINNGLITEDASSIIKSISKDLASFEQIIKKNKLNYILVLGDRFEILAPVITSFFLNIPIIHLHGGEKTFGSNDDIIRHVVSKFSYYHFVAHKDYKRRLIQLGENSKNIYVSGGLGPDNIIKFKFYKKNETKKILDIDFKKLIYLVTFHPETNNAYKNKKSINELLKSLENLKNTTIIFTAPNPDIFSKYIIDQIKIFTKKNKNSFLKNSLGKKLYFSLLSISDLVIGNSSSGIIETPTLKIPTINIGQRQKGRLISENIINSSNSSNSIKLAIKKANHPKFKERLKKIKNIYQKKNTNLFIYKKIISLIDKKITPKEFIDLK